MKKRQDLPRPSPSRTPVSAEAKPHGSLLPEIRTDAEAANTSSATLSLEAFSSSPTAAAAARTISRALSRSSLGLHEVGTRS